MSEGAGEQRSTRTASLADAIIPLAVLAGLIAAALALFGLDALDGPIQAALVLCCMVAALIALKNRHRWDEIQRAAQGALSSVTSAIFILLAVGALIGLWNLSGTIPTLVYYGLQVLSPGWYYVAAALICGVVAMSIGSSWTTTGTIGVGLVTIAVMLGVSPEITAGAVISGAYLGDKTSPLSETTILASQIVEVNVYDHIKRQVWTSVPAFGIAIVVFLLLGLTHTNETDAIPTSVELKELSDVFWITPLNLLPLALLAFLSIRKLPASLALAFSALFAGVLGAFLQPGVMRDFIAGDGNVVLESIKGIWIAMANGFAIDSGLSEIDQLLSRGGMDSMLSTLWLIIGAVTFGALLEEFGMIARLIDPAIRAAQSTAKLFLTVFASCLCLNIVAGDQYIALLLPARVFRAEFARRGLAPTNLSRLTADCGTVTSPLVPWNSCGAFMGAVLGVPTLLYLPYCIFNLASPALSILIGVTGFKLERIEPAAEPPAETPLS